MAWYFGAAALERNGMPESQSRKAKLDRALVVLEGVILFLISIQFLFTSFSSLSDHIDPASGTSIYKAVLVKVAGAVFVTLSIVLVYLGTFATTDARLMRMKAGLATSREYLLVLAAPVLIVILIIQFGSPALNLIRLLVKS